MRLRHLFFVLLLQQVSISVMLILSISWSFLTLISLSISSPMFADLFSTVYVVFVVNFVSESLFCKCNNTVATSAKGKLESC